jgi:hypothetical protein
MILVGGLFVTGALAAVISTSSTTLLRVDHRSNNTGQGTSSNTFIDLTGASVPVTVPASGRLIRARFTAEGRCDGSPGTGNCIARIVAFNTATSATTELNPATGTDFVFSPANGTFSGAHAMERSRRLTAATYNIKVQFAVTGVMVGNTLDDWHFTVETYQ